MPELIPERLIELREAAKLSQTRLAELCGIGQSTIARLESGETRNPRNLMEIAHVLGTTPAYLVGAVDDPSLLGLPKGPLAPRLEEPVPSDMVELAEIDLRFGLGAAYMDEEVLEHSAQRRLFPREWIRQITPSPPSRLCWAQGQGNSMEPTIGDGDIILIDRSQITPGFGDLYWAISYGQTGMIKRLRPMPDGSVKILSDNPSVPPETAYDGELNVFGRVVAVVKRI